MFPRERGIGLGALEHKLGTQPKRFSQLGKARSPLFLGVLRVAANVEKDVGGVAKERAKDLAASESEHAAGQAVLDVEKDGADASEVVPWAGKGGG
jgi:hypothetical protein